MSNRNVDRGVGSDAEASWQEDHGSYVLLKKDVKLSAARVRGLRFGPSIISI